jgi:predicted ATPase
MEGRPFIETVSVSNFKSIDDVQIALGPLTVLVGRNGTGKSNFLDSLHFVSDALVMTLTQAILLRGGARAMSHNEAPRVTVEITFRLSDNGRGTYTLALDQGLVDLERLRIIGSDGVERAGYQRVFRTLVGHVENEWFPSNSTVLPDRLALVTLSGLRSFREAFDILSSMRFYRFNPEAMRELQDLDEGTVLRTDGSNIASVWRHLEAFDSHVIERLVRFMGVIVPEIRDIRPVRLGPKETLRFHQTGADLRELLFYASSMSDGTLRALGALIASRQGNGTDATPTFVAIEEPETALHPGAVAVLMDALHEASANTQIIITSHSPDLLDHVDVETDALLVTDMRDGATTIAAVDGASLDAIRRDLYTPGELLRMDQLHPAAAR